MDTGELAARARTRGDVALAGAEMALGKKAMLPCALELGEGWVAIGGEEAPNAQP